MWSVSEDALVAGMAANHGDAAVAFVERFQRRVFGLALTIVGDRQAAQDVAQETFLRAWRNAATYDPRRGTVPAWLLSIARNLAIDAIRVRRPTPMDPEQLLVVSRPAGGPGPEDEAVTTDDVARVRRVLAELPSEQRRALVLAAFGGLTAREVSEQEHVPLGTAKTRIRTALLRVRDALLSEERAE
ncbi:MAG: sigma-70 family RNA polymerase sigma factor [Acidimicrobiia bacterium]